MRRTIRPSASSCAGRFRGSIRLMSDLADTIAEAIEKSEERPGGSKLNGMLADLLG
jgi:hypothetical protein